jgi:hypothetical protein
MEYNYIGISISYCDEVSKFCDLSTITIKNQATLPRLYSKIQMNPMNISLAETTIDRK